MDGLYNPDGTIRPIPIPGARWAIGRIGINFIENTPVFSKDHPEQALALLDLAVNASTLDQFFPKDHQGNRCPTFELMFLWHQLGGDRNTTGSVLV